MPTKRLLQLSQFLLILGRERWLLFGLRGLRFGVGTLALLMQHHCALRILVGVAPTLILTLVVPGLVGLGRLLVAEGSFVFRRLRRLLLFLQLVTRSQLAFGQRCDDLDDLGAVSTRFDCGSLVSRTVSQYSIFDPGFTFNAARSKISVFGTGLACLLQVVDRLEDLGPLMDVERRVLDAVVVGGRRSRAATLTLLGTLISGWSGRTNVTAVGASCRGAR